jgi:hypothetical protein
MFKCVLSSAALALLTVTTTLAQQGPANRSADATSGKVAVPVGPLLEGEEKLSAKERAERTFLMPARKKMPSVHPTAATPPRPEPDPTSTEATAIGPLLTPSADEADEAVAPAAKTTVKRTYHRSSSRRSSSSSRKKTTTKKKTTHRRR